MTDPVLDYLAAKERSEAAQTEARIALDEAVRLYNGLSPEDQARAVALLSGREKARRAAMSPCPACSKRAAQAEPMPCAGQGPSSYPCCCCDVCRHQCYEANKHALVQP